MHNPLLASQCIGVYIKAHSPSASHADASLQYTTPLDSTRSFQFPK